VKPEERKGKADGKYLQKRKVLIIIIIINRFV